MRKVLSIFICCLTFALVGCSNSENTPKTDESNYKAQQELENKQKKEASSKAYSEGIKELAVKNYYNATVQLLKVIPIDPNYKDAQAKLIMAKTGMATRALSEGKIELKAGSFSEAIIKFEEAIDNNPNLEEAKKLKQQAQVKYDAQQKKIAAQEAALARKVIKEKMKIYEGDGDVQIAVGDVKLKRSTEMHVATGNGTFVYVQTSVENNGNNIIHANPNDFSLSTPSGETVSHDSDTYSLDNYFDAVDLRPGNSTDGWLIFYTTKSDEYTLNYQGFGGTASKKIVVK
ncbi:MAG: DUF4352 domain-containing protein [Carboxydocellales bacterium]